MLNIFQDYLIKMYKQEIVYDKPLFIGTTILDLSKLHMMKFHYDIIHSYFEYRYQLIYMDTDSFMYNAYHSDVYHWVREKYDTFYYTFLLLQEIFISLMIHFLRLLLNLCCIL